MTSRLAALDFITGCLSVRGEKSHNEALRSAIEADGFCWQVVISIANTELVAPALWVALKDRHLTEYVPVDARTYLKEIHRLNGARNAGLEAQAIEAVQQLNAVGIEPLLLKGSAGLFAGPFKDPGSRVMVDIDILVPDAAAKYCWALLCEAGYQPMRSRGDRQRAGLRSIDYDIHHHLRPLYRVGSYGLIELHRAAVPDFRSQLLPDGLLWRNAERVQQDTAVMYIPDPTARVLHNLVHSTVVDEAYVRGRIPMRSLHELAQMQARYGERVEWEIIRRQFEGGAQSKAFCSTLYLAYKLFAMRLPKGVDRTLGSKMHYMRARIQMRWDWTHKLVERVLWFRASEVCERSDYRSEFFWVTKWRIKLAIRLVVNFAIRTIRWTGKRNRIRAMRKSGTN